MEAEAKSRDYLLQIFSMDFDEDTSDVNALPHFNKQVTEFQFLFTYEIFSPRPKIAEFYFLKIGVRFDGTRPDYDVGLANLADDDVVHQFRPARP